MIDRIKGYWTFFKRYGLLTGLILLAILPAIRGILAGLETEQ